ncbi:WD repeat-containing protein 38 [Pichia californica]|uniref:WD repeat-containing protein 38 n=1 Tax=Pichia californica TaxID=460514 RepID=A0A9P7BIH7_9ASCO|nr:WD repeat-containing protein 38 [[Candida] californica]KAG0691113.1 WD repeat-containing protein 38 [[Candida] californica]
MEDVRLDAHSGPIYTAKFNEDGTYIASGGTDCTIKLWNLEQLDTETNNEMTIETENEQDIQSGAVFEEKVCDSAVTWIQWSRLEDSHLFISSADHNAIIFDLNKSVKIKTFKHPACVNQLGISKRDYLITSCDDGKVRLYDKRSREPTAVINSPIPNLNLPVLTCCIDDDAQRFYFSGIDPTIYSYDTRKLSLCWSENRSHSNNVTSLSLSPDESYLLSKSVDNTIKYYDARILPESDILLRNRGKPYVFDGPTSSEDDWLVRSIFIPDPTSESNELLNIISGSNDGYTYVWEFASRKLINRLDGQLATVYDIDYSEINNQIVTTSADGSLVIRNL